MNYLIFNENCISGSVKIKDNSVDLMIADPPFGINESKFQKHYKRDDKNVLQGYQEAPKEYADWCMEWLTPAKRILSDNGSLYLISGHTNLRHILNVAENLNLHLINHIIWKYNFGVYTKKKYVTSHYHVLYYSKNPNAKVTFNTHCRFGSHEKDDSGRSKLYHDLEDVFVINKDYSPKEIKNQNKLPEELLKKIISYSSNPNDLVCDFFMGNFTTAYAALKLGRRVCGFEINKTSYDYHIAKLEEIQFGQDIKFVENIVPKNQGKPITEHESLSICKDYDNMLKCGMPKKDISLALQEKYGRGRFAIKNILDKY